MPDAEQLSAHKIIYVIAGLLLGVIVVTIIIIAAVGKAYRGSLNVGINTVAQKEIEVGESQEIKKIKIKKKNSSECIEVGPDGIVRIYKNCDGNLTQAFRMDSLKQVNELFRQVREKQYDTSFPNTGQAYELFVETASGTQTIIIWLTDDNNDLVDLIETIEQQVPSPTPQLNPSPSSLITPSVTPQASATVPPGSTPQPSPSTLPGASDIPFSCNFNEGQSGTKPVPVSQTICSDEPQ